MNVILRRETFSDAAAIRAVTQAAFLDAPHSSGTEQFIVEALRAADRLSVSLVALEDDEIVGHVAVSPVSISNGAQGWYGLGPISVLPKRQGCGIGTRMMQGAIDALKVMQARGCVLLGDPGFYVRFGFRNVPALVLPDVPAQFFQALAFQPPIPEGTVTYHAAFEATGPANS